MPAEIRLRPLAYEDLTVAEPWFRDPDTVRYLGGPGWLARMLARDKGLVGQEFRGAVQTGVHRYLAEADGAAVGFIDCGMFDRCVAYGGEGAGGPIILESLDVSTGAIAFVVDPARRRRGLGRAMIGTLLELPELRSVSLFEAGVEPDNIASRRCLEKAGFRLRSVQPDFEGMLYYRCWNGRAATLDS